MSRRAATLALAAVVAATAMALVSSPARAAEPIWRLEQPPPPAGVPFKVPLGAPGDLQFWEANRGLLTVEGNETIPRGIYSWDGQSWHQLASVCGGPGDTARIAWAGPREFWVISEPSLPRVGSGLALCRFKDGQVVDSWSTRADAVDPFRQMMAATCDGPDDCWFGGVGDQDPLGERVGAFHLHWNGVDLESFYGPQGRGVSDMQFHDGKLYESTLVGRAPENRTEAVDLAEPEAAPRLLHTIAGDVFANDPFVPAAAANSTELLALDGDAQQLWAVGGGAASGPAAPQGGAVARAPLAARLVGGAFDELDAVGRLRSDRSLHRCGGDPRYDGSARRRRAVRRSPQRQQQGDGGADRRRRHDDPGALACRRRRSRQRRADRLSGDERLLDGHLGRLALPLQRRHAAGP